MLSINTNTSSLIAQNSLKTSTNKLNQAIERMSSGAKINHAKDNAANYSIATNMTTKINAYQVAEDNCAMGLDLVSTASSSLEQILDLTTRLRALATQAQNGTYGAQSLTSIKTEANAILDEIGRIYSTAEYNGIKLFGTTGISFIQEINQRDTSEMTKLSSIDPTQSLTSGTYSISTAEELAQLATMTNDGLINGGEFVLANNIDLSSVSNWTPIGYNNNNDVMFVGTFDGNGYEITNMYSEGFEASLFGLVGDSTIKNLGVSGTAIADDGASLLLLGITDAEDVSYTLNIQNCYVSGTVEGVNCANGIICFSWDKDSTINIQDCYVSCDLKSDFIEAPILALNVSKLKVDNCYFNGTTSQTTSFQTFIGLSESEPEITGTCYFNSDLAPNLYGTFDDTGNGYNLSGIVGLKEDEFLAKLSNKTLFTSMNFQVGISSLASSQINFEIGGIDLSTLNNLDLTSNKVFTTLDDILSKINDQQTSLGAVQNRLESALDEISTQYENLVSSRSTIMDADMAELSSEYIKMQILQEASATLMATANQNPSIALQLL